MRAAALLPLLLLLCISRGNSAHSARSTAASTGSSPPYKKFFEQASAFFDEQDYARAEPLFAAAGDAAKAAGERVAAMCFVNQASCLAHLQQWDASLAASDKAVASDSTDWRSWSNHGLALFNLGRAHEAAQSFQTSLDRGPPAEDAKAIRKNLNNVKDLRDNPAGDEGAARAAGAARWRCSCCLCFCCCCSY